ncbi:MAG: DUF721 domain-containing protein [Actinobacteria bacterium]|nr:DUF721 domain-containing protein [Actinomycetota bacterium]
MRKINGILREALAGEGLDRVEDLLAIKRAWNGSGRFPEGTPCGFRGKRLVVRVRSHAWAHEMNMRRQEIMEFLKNATGVEIEGIVIKVKPEV